MTQTLTSPCRIQVTDSIVSVTPRVNCKNIIMRRASDGSLRASVPYGIDAARAVEIMRSLLPRLMAKTAITPALTYTAPWSYDFPEGSLRITLQSLKPEHVIANFSPREITIGVGCALTPSQPATAKIISRLILRAAARISPGVLIPHARSTAARLGIDRISWEIGRGTRTLGSCYPSQRRIILSAACLFVPAELREFVICHELAHLTHANHSAAFHSLCNTYLEGKEKALISRLKSWQWPILR